MTSLLPTPPYFIGVLVDDGATRSRLEADLAALCPSGIEPVFHQDAQGARDWIRKAGSGEIHVPILILDEDIRGFDGKGFIRTVESDKENLRLGFIRLTSRSDAEQGDRLIESEAPSRTLTKPWLFEVLADAVRDLLHHYLVNHARQDLDRFSEFVGLPDLFPPGEALEDRSDEGGLSFLSDRDLTDRQAFESLVQEIDAVLKNPDRRTLSPGTILFAEREAIEEVYILESGQVRLTRMAGDREVLFHSHSAGRILGLLALAQNRRAFFTCRAVTEVRVIPIGLAALNGALHDHPKLASSFATVLVRSLAARNRRVAELQLEIEILNSQLVSERDELANALRLLAAAQGRIIESDRMATLGKLAAGVAHELNNPVAAIGRSAEHLAVDLLVGLSELSSNRMALEAMKRGQESPPLSTREERAIRAAFTRKLGDEEMARDLIGMGVHTERDLDRFLEEHPAPELRVAASRGERFFRIGRSLRNLVHCSGRVADLVQGLKSYARWDRGEAVEGDLHQGIEDALAIFSHELRRIRVTRRFGEIPRVRCQLGRLNQVWTNLLSNAIQAMEGEGTLTIETERWGADCVRVTFTDSGPGIPKERLERIFEESFTTKGGKPDFGLGLGLTICREILKAQGGDLRFESRPGQTSAIVTLPIGPPPGGVGANPPGG